MCPGSVLSGWWGEEQGKGVSYGSVRQRVLAVRRSGRDAEYAGTGVGLGGSSRMSSVVSEPSR